MSAKDDKAFEQGVKNFRRERLQELVALVDIMESGHWSDDDKKHTDRMLNVVEALSDDLKFYAERELAKK